MKYHGLKANPRKKSNRVGRGIAAGRGKTAGRGTKGQGARAGSSKRPGFEGGQNPLMQRLPKLPGFKSHRSKSQNVFTGQLENLKVKIVDAQALADAGLILNPYEKVKLLSKGELSKALTVKLPAASESAIEAVQKAGGSFEKTARLSRQAKAGPKKSK